MILLGDGFYVSETDRLPFNNTGACAVRQEAPGERRRR